jgi:hypothetical protein
VTREGKTRYRRSTPVIRLRRNVGKISRLADLVAERLEGWSSLRGGAADSDVVEALSSVTVLRGSVSRLDEAVARLESRGFVPPRRSTSYQPKVTDHVKVIARYKKKYVSGLASALSRDPTYLDDLVVSVVSGRGEIWVRRLGDTPFLVRKSHLASIRSSGA